MSRDTTLCISAGWVRRAAEMVSHAETQLIDIGLDEVALQLLDTRLKLEELRLDMIDAAYQTRPTATRPRNEAQQPELPF